MTAVNANVRNVGQGKQYGVLEDSECQLFTLDRTASAVIEVQVHAAQGGR